MSRLELINLNTYGIRHLYHMTHIANLPSILQYGLLAHGNRFQKHDISNKEVNRRRSAKDPFYGKSLHAYVPFYFNPRNAMLFVQGRMQDNIVILKINREVMFENGVLITDGNAAALDTRFSNDVKNLSMINWDCVHAKYWNDFPDGKRQMMAEVLVPRRIDAKEIESIACNNVWTKEKIEKLTKGRIFSEIDYSLYFRREE